MFVQLATNLLSLCFAASVALISAVFPAWGQSGDVFSVSGVTVDARAADELLAKSSGIARAQRTALRMLFERLTLRDDHDRLPEVDNSTVSEILRDFSIDDERFGGGHYLATLTVRFKPAGVRAQLTGAGVPFAETASRPILILPVFQTAASTLLWADDNPWFAAWTRLRRADGLLPLIIPVGDLADVSDVSADQAVLGESEKLSAIAKRYGARSTIVMVATLGVSKVDGALSLEVAASRYGVDQTDQTTFRRFVGKPGTSRDALFLDTANALVEEAEESWKRGNLLERNIEQWIAVGIPLSGLENWLAIRKRLRAIAGLKKFIVTRLSVDRADVEFLYLGKSEQLRLAMAQSDLELVYAPENATWTLRYKER